MNALRGADVLDMVKVVLMVLVGSLGVSFVVGQYQRVVVEDVITSGAAKAIHK
jgi:hypothetical protein